MHSWCWQLVSTSFEYSKVIIRIKYVPQSRTEFLIFFVWLDYLQPLDTAPRCHVISRNKNLVLFLNRRLSISIPIAESVQIFSHIKPLLFFQNIASVFTRSDRFTWAVSSSVLALSPLPAFLDVADAIDEDDEFRPTDIVLLTPII